MWLQPPVQAGMGRNSGRKGGNKRTRYTFGRHTLSCLSQVPCPLKSKSIARPSTHARLAICFLLGLLLWHLSGWVEIDVKAWHIFAVFLAVILGFILRPFPMGMTVLLGLLVLVGSRTITLEESLSGFADTTVWLVIAAFLLAGAVLHTGFGTRVALWFVIKLGKTLKGLAYGICTSEFLLGSVIPSNTARGGGIHAPIVDSLVRSMQRGTSNDHSHGKYLSLVGAHANLIAASTFMTGMAANPLVSAAAKDVFSIDFGWGTWLLGSIVPAICSFMLLPQILMWLAPPLSDDSQLARQTARSQLEAMGSMQPGEKVMLGVLVSMLILWATQFIHGLSTTFIAWSGVAALLLSNAQTWTQIIENSKAWETLFWLGGLLTMADLLAEYGFIDWFVEQSSALVASTTGISVIIILGLIYFYSMVAFSMLSGHIAAMVVPFFSVCLAADANPMLSIAIFAYFSCLCGCTTNYSTGPVIIYFGLGYVRAPQWFGIGFLISFYHLAIWLGIGLLWWKLLGWW